MPPHATAAAAVPPSAPKDRDAAAAATMSTQQPGERSQQPYRVGSYVIREEIGRGSFATVFRGEKTVSLVPSKRLPMLMIPATRVLRPCRRRARLHP